MPKYVSINRLRQTATAKDVVIRLDSARRSDVRVFLENYFIDWNNVTIALGSATIDATDDSSKKETYSVVFAHRGPLAGKKHTESYIATKYDKIDLQYYEYWRELDDLYVLERIYLNFVYNIDGRKFDIFAIHVDPLKKKGYSIYESMPHYHFYLTPKPLSKMHIPLDAIKGEKSTEDYATLKQVFTASIKAMSKELETRHRIVDSKIDKFIRVWNASEA